MDDADVMRVVETGADLLDEGQLLRQRERLPPLDQLAERRPVHVLHRDERLMVVVADLVDGHEVFVSQVRGGARFPQEPLQQLLVGHRLPEHFDGDVAIEIRIAAQIHRAHAAVPETAHDVVLGDLRRRLSQFRFAAGGDNYTGRPASHE